MLFDGRVFHPPTAVAFDEARPELSDPRWTKADDRGGRGER
jgi:hypothetical protein